MKKGTFIDISVLLGVDNIQVVSGEKARSGCYQSFSVRARNSKYCVRCHCVDPASVGAWKLSPGQKACPAGQYRYVQYLFPIPGRSDVLRRWRWQ